jgi:hypothetical protein
VDSTEVSPRDFAIVYDNKATNIESIILLMEVGELDVSVADEESTVWAYELQNDLKMAKYFDLFTELSTGSERSFVLRVLAKDLHAVTTVFSELYHVVAGLDSDAVLAVQGSSNDGLGLPIRDDDLNFAAQTGKKLKF